jgi:general secretion pathway protein K
MRTSLCSKQHGAALLVALLITALVTVILTAMLQRQSALAGIEWQLRETAQARRIIQGAEDWALLILREDARTSVIDHRGEAWATALKEGRLSDFLKAAQEGATSGSADIDDSRVQDVWLSGQIIDAEARYNLMRLATSGAAAAQERALWLRVAAQAGLPADLAHEVMDQFAAPAVTGRQTQQPPPEPPLSLTHLSARLPALSPWVARLSALAVILPEATTINVNTAAKPVLMALIPNLDDALAERFIELRLRAPPRNLNDITAAFNPPLTIDPTQAGVTSRYFILSSQVRLGAKGTRNEGNSTTVSMTALVQRYAQTNSIQVVRRDFGAAQPGLP